MAVATFFGLKRPGEEFALVPSKKARNDLAVATIANNQAPPRTSSLRSPIMLLTGHQGEIFCSKFHPNGQTLASCGTERVIFLWNVYGECENYAVLSGHTGAVVDLNFNTDGSMIVTASVDKTIGIWDSETGQRIRKLKGHKTFVNSCHPARRGPQMIASGSDDGTVKLWDSRKKTAINSFDNGYAVTAVTFNDTSEQIISGGIDNDVKIWDLRKNDRLHKLRGHTDTVTGVSLSPDGFYVISNSMDNTVRLWDIRPFAAQERCLKIFHGHQHNFEKNPLKCSWSPDGNKISAGSSDRFVYIWDTNTKRILYKLPGHNGSVNEVHFHPNEPIIASGSSDKQIFLGEIE